MIRVVRIHQMCMLERIPDMQNCCSKGCQWTRLAVGMQQSSAADLPTSFLQLRHLWTLIRSTFRLILVQIGMMGAQL